jgi:nucleoside-diphosphate-sugar epimerase
MPPPPCALVLGGNGFVGVHVTNALAAAGYRVVCINRGNSYWSNADEEHGGEGEGGEGGGEEGKEGVGGARQRVIKCDRKDRGAFERAVDAATSAFSGSDEGDEDMEVDGSNPGGGGGSGERRCWDVVVDLSGFTPGDLRAALRGLKGRTKVYVYISSDSVYEVCVAGGADTDVDNNSTDGAGAGADGAKDFGGCAESSAVRPEDARVATRLARDDRYGHHKLRCEEILARAGTVAGAGGRAAVPDLSSDSSSSGSSGGMSWSGSDESDTADSENSDDDDGNGGGGGRDAADAGDDVNTKNIDDDGDDDGLLVPVRWVALRLPDVIGPRDATTRLWRYQLWLQCAHELGPVAVEPALSRRGTRRMSLAYAPDVARAVLAVAEVHGSIPDRVHPGGGGGGESGGGVSGGGGVTRARGRAYNIACRERVSLEELMELIADVEVVRESLNNAGGDGGFSRPLVVVDGKKNTKKRRRGDDDEEAAAAAEEPNAPDDQLEQLHRSERLDRGKKRRDPPSFLPSVDRGPVDVSRALRELVDWEPTPLATAVAETVRWFHAASSRARDRSGRHPHEEECREVARELRRGFGLRPGCAAAVALQKRLTQLGFPSPRR